MLWISEGESNVGMREQIVAKIDLNEVTQRWYCDWAFLDAFI